MIDTSGHHIVYGVLQDYLTGEELPDTDDERNRQQLARFFVEQKGYLRSELEPRRTIETGFSGRTVRSVIDLTITLAGRRIMIVRYGPGSLVTRERPAIAGARLLEPGHMIPLAVVTNCRDAELLDTLSSRVLAHGLAAIPDRERLEGMLSELVFLPLVDQLKREREGRILHVFDEEVCCRGEKCSLPLTKTE